MRQRIIKSSCIPNHHLHFAEGKWRLCEDSAPAPRVHDQTGCSEAPRQGASCSAPPWLRDALLLFLVDVWVFTHMPQEQTVPRGSHSHLFPSGDHPMHLVQGYRPPHCPPSWTRSASTCPSLPKLYIRELLFHDLKTTLDLSGLPHSSDCSLFLS